MQWLALLPLPCPRDEPQVHRTPIHFAQQSLGWWALRFTPRVAWLEEAVVAEVSASQRLFGGAQALRERIEREALTQPCAQVSWADNGLAALALARCGVAHGMGLQGSAMLDALPLRAVTAVHAQQATLARLGCLTLGDVRALPRQGLSRRLGPDLLRAIDQIHGQQAQAHTWITLPETLDVRMDLPFRIDTAPALMWAARHLLEQMGLWLTARHAGVSAFTLSWQCDGRRRDHDASLDALTLRTAEPTRQIDHLARLLSEHLAQVRLQAPVEGLRLRADEVHAVPEHTASLLPSEQRSGQTLVQLLEHLSARLGSEAVQTPVCHPDHRLGHAQTWQAAQGAGRSKEASLLSASAVPQPTWLLRQPLRLAVQGTQPSHHGTLQLLAGPYRIEGGWWDMDSGHPANQARDYFVAHSPRAGLLWVFHERPKQAGSSPHASAHRDDQRAWYVHGVFG